MVQKAPQTLKECQNGMHALDTGKNAIMAVSGTDAPAKK